MSDIFISYAREDRPKAQQLAEALENQGWFVWWDKTIPAGKKYSDVIDEALSKAKAILVLWSEISVKSDWVLDEAQEGFKRNILIPVLIEQVNQPLGFRQIEAADMIGWEGSVNEPAFIKLEKDISNIIVLHSSSHELSCEKEDNRIKSISESKKENQKIRQEVSDNSVESIKKSKTREFLGCSVNIIFFNLAISISMAVLIVFGGIYVFRPRTVLLEKSLVPIVATQRQKVNSSEVHFRGPSNSAENINKINRPITHIGQEKQSARMNTKKVRRDSVYNIEGAYAKSDSYKDINYNAEFGYGFSHKKTGLDNIIKSSKDYSRIYLQGLDPADTSSQCGMFIELNKAERIDEKIMDIVPGPDNKDHNDSSDILQNR